MQYETNDRTIQAADRPKNLNIGHITLSKSTVTGHFSMISDACKTQNNRTTVKKQCKIMPKRIMWKVNIIKKSFWKVIQRKCQQVKYYGICFKLMSIQPHPKKLSRNFGGILFIPRPQDDYRESGLTIQSPTCLVPFNLWDRSRPCDTPST